MSAPRFLSGGQTIFRLFDKNRTNYPLKRGNKSDILNVIYPSQKKGEDNPLFFKNFFLFQRQAEKDWSLVKKILLWVWTAAVLLCAAVGLTLVSLLLSVGPYPVQICAGFLETPIIFLMNLLPIVTILFLFYGLTGRPGASFLAAGALVLLYSFGTYYKLMFRDDPVMFADLFILKEVGNMAGNYHLFLDKTLLVALACYLIGWLFLHFFVRARLPRIARIICSVAALLALIGSISLCRDDGIYNTKAKNYSYLNNQWSSTQQYIARGGLYPFFHSINEAFETPPEGYDKSEAKEVLAQYEDADIPEDKKVNVVAIMLEAYNDFTNFGQPQLAQDVYKVWHDLEAEGYSGNLLTNIFAGGTIDTERCFLTGYSTLNNFRKNTNSYPWYFRSQGYTVEGMHPCYQWFYNRLNVNQYLGFENYYFVENLFTQYTNGNVAMDKIFFPELIKAYEAGTAGDDPYFNFSVTYQGHGPYNSSRCWWGEVSDFVVDDGTYTPEQLTIMANYLGSVADTNKHLKELTDYFRTDDEPVVLVLFGDHNPWMGDGNSVYTAMGLNFDLSTQEGFYDYYSTRYIIWANDAAKEALGKDFQGEGPDVGPYFLMNLVFEQCGWDGPAYLQATNAVSAQVPMVHKSGRYLENGTLTSVLSDAGAALVEEYKSLQYYWRNNFSD